METYTDLITGKKLPYNDDEYIRQAVEKILLEKGYTKEHVEVDAFKDYPGKDCFIKVKADLLITLNNQPVFIMRCARGSLVTRERETLATALLISDPSPVLAIICNGNDALVMKVETGKVIAEGMDAIPDIKKLSEILNKAEPYHPTEEKRQKALRIYNAYSFLQCPPGCTV